MCGLSHSLSHSVRTAIIMPDDIAIEKVNAMKCLGATVERVRPASIVDTKHVRPLLGFSIWSKNMGCLIIGPSLFQFVVWRLSGTAGGTDLHNHAQ